MSHSSDLIDSFYQIQKDYFYLTSFHYTRDTELMDFEVSLQVRLAKTTYDYDEQLLITFAGVRDLKLGDFNWISAIVFEISDVSKDQLEGIRYLVEDCGEHMFNLYCRQITFEVIR